MPKNKDFENLPLPLFEEDMTNTNSNHSSDLFEMLKNVTVTPNISDFERYLSIIEKELTYITDDSFKWENVVALLIIQLKNTDCLNKANEKSHATQIQITSERNPEPGQSRTDDFFPTFTINKTFKSWRIRVQARIHSDNIAQLEGNAIKNRGWKNTSIQIRRRILNEDGDQGNATLHLCYEDDLLDLRQLLEVDDYLVITKQKNSMVYEAFGLRNDVPLGNGKRMYTSSTAVTDKTIFDTSINIEEIQFAKGGENLIVYGAPGVGKSHYLENNKSREILKESFKKRNYTRTTFHPDYTYYDFIGSYKPVPLYKKNESQDKDTNLVTVDGSKCNLGEPVIDYQFVPGPFTKALIDAFSKPDEMHTLIIEELNRANAPAVFGDLFQLLDRDADGKSEYTIWPDPELDKYLRRNNINISGLYIPSNLNVFATMNSADQGVFVMDTAFKRRWNFMYMSARFDEKVEHADEPVDYAGTRVTWSAFATAINKHLGSSECKVNEDKFIGPYFLKAGEPSNLDRVASKLLIYLWDDVVRFQREKLFRKEITTFSELIRRYKDGQEIFVFGLDDIKINATQNPFAYLMGRLVSEDVFDADGNMLFKSGETIDEQMISNAADHNMINELEKMSKNP